MSGPWREFAATLDLNRAGEEVELAWQRPTPGTKLIGSGRLKLYARPARDGDASSPDPVAQNAGEADKIIAEIVHAAGLAGGAADAGPVDAARLAREEAFHDGWASSVRAEEVMVRESFEACTAPEHRHILTELGDLKGRSLLDLGCGLGEASVYFATRGAAVTACDLSGEMLETTKRVAAHHGVTVKTHQAPAEKTGLPDGLFDVVYAGNMLHHVDIPVVLDEIRRVLRPGGVFVSWDPLAHNPIINVYRRLAAGMRTEDEHPIQWSELSLFQDRFTSVRWRCYWLSTLLIFLKFYLVDRVHPSSERYWKKILTDAHKLGPLYRPLERLDCLILRLAPWLGRYCWNIVVVAVR